MYYSEYVSIQDSDQTIACHPFIDASNGSIAYRLLEQLGIPCIGKTVLDAGAGTGQVSRFLKGYPGLIVEACDVDPCSEAYFHSHPELQDIPFIRCDLLADELPKQYDAIICRGVYHHIPKTKRPHFLKKLCGQADIVIISDEGIEEYSNNEERMRNCDLWYGYVVSEAKRRGLTKLAEMEHKFWKHERLNTADDGGDFKESPTHLLEDARRVGLFPIFVEKLGDWKKRGGGFFTITFVTDSLKVS